MGGSDQSLPPRTAMRTAEAPSECITSTRTGGSASRRPTPWNYTTSSKRPPMSPRNWRQVDLRSTSHEILTAFARDFWDEHVQTTVPPHVPHPSPRLDREPHPGMPRRDWWCLSAIG